MGHGRQWQSWFDYVKLMCSNNFTVCWISQRHCTCSWPLPSWHWIQHCWKFLRSGFRRGFHLKESAATASSKKKTSLALTVSDSCCASSRRIQRRISATIGFEGIQDRSVKKSSCESAFTPQRKRCHRWKTIFTGRQNPAVRATSFGSRSRNCH